MRFNCEAVQRLISQSLNLNLNPNLNQSHSLKQPRKVPATSIIPFIDQCLSYLKLYARSKTKHLPPQNQTVGSFAVWLNDHFRAVYLEQKKIVQALTRFYLSWKGHCSSNQEANLLLTFLSPEFGDPYTVREFFRYRKEVMKYSQQKSLDKVTLDYESILLILGRLYPEECMVFMRREVKAYMGRIQTPTKCDTRMKAPLACGLILQLLKKYEQSSRQQRAPRGCYSSTYNECIFDQSSISQIAPPDSRSEQDHSLDALHLREGEKWAGSTLPTNNVAISESSFESACFQTLNSKRVKVRSLEAWLDEQDETEKSAEGHHSSTCFSVKNTWDAKEPIFSIREQTQYSEQEPKSSS